MESVRTPEERFSRLPDFPFEPRYNRNTAMTIEAWVYREDASRCETVLSQGFSNSYWLGFCPLPRFYRSGGTSADADIDVPARQWTHVAVAYEEPREVLARYTDNDIRVGKIQISSALQVLLDQPRTPIADALAPFVESTYLHQVVQRNRDGSLTQFPDLDQALPHIHNEQAAEWRIHFHVPIFIDHYGLLRSTQDAIVETFALLDEEPFTRHLEIETYTWDVLPADLKKPLDASIRREFEWVLENVKRET